jgi:hypothetical protein
MLFLKVALYTEESEEPGLRTLPRPEKKPYPNMEIENRRLGI